MQGKLINVTRFVLRKIFFWPFSAQVAHFIGEPFFWFLGLRGKRREIALSLVKRVLIVRLDEIGDVVLTTPLLRELRRNLPDAWITLLVKPGVYNLVELCPYVNEVLTYDWKTLMPLDWNIERYFWQLEQYSRALHFAWKHFWRRRFDLAILPRWDADYYNATFLAYFSGAHWRVGYPEHVSCDKRRLNDGFDRLLTHVVSNNTHKHEVECNLNIIRFLGGVIQEEQLELWVTPEDEAFAERVLRLRGVHPGDLLIAFGPGKRHLRRRWPLSRFIQLGAWLKKKYSSRMLVVGDIGDKPLGDALERQLGAAVINMVGQTDLRQAVALLKHCCLYIGNDYGPKHIAAAAGVPVIEVNGHPLDGPKWHSYSPRRFGPWRVPHIVLQPETALPPCSEVCNCVQAHCILGVEVEQVKEAVAAQLSRQKGSVFLEQVRQDAV